MGFLSSAKKKLKKLKSKSKNLFGGAEKIGKYVTKGAKSFGQHVEKGAEGAVQNVSDFAGDRFDRVRDYAQGAGSYLSAVGRDVREGYRRYKDPIIIGAGTLLGAAIGTLIAPGAGTIYGASLGGSLAGAARGPYTQRQAAQQARDEAHALEGSDPYLDPRRRKNVFGSAGEGVLSYSTEGTPTYGTYEVAS